MLGGYLEFFMNPTIAEMYRSLRRELDELIHTKVSYYLTLLSILLKDWFTTDGMLF